MTSPVEALLRRHRIVTIAALAVLTLIAWAWLWAGAGMGMTPRFDFDFSPAPPAPPAMPGMDMKPAVDPALARVPLVFSMWWVMMVAMMLPAAAPVILIYATVSRNMMPGAPVATGSFLAGYLTIWAFFSIVAALAQVWLEDSSLLEPMRMAPVGHWLPAALLFVAGLYQLSPFKEVCLEHCRNPASFLSRHLRPGRAGTFRTGAVHGAYCLGCCWLLMALLFVGGVMNLAWIALLTLLVAGEKLLPRGRLLSLAAGAGFIVWGGALALA
ncbi:DUF2182 domain-containing protein [Altererythrobacter salegens]|uniref:DUF2182 domain-containing protein n=1 Tax=Croceibacterium salegens TaxID=1737568 RepID=A0A6I4SYA6_9SPHN|nr:DUF2182 domain-containing protein [Croceibacterium salegens]MXO60823.1 DUF2182 domain-containing protein [Croceibacterium salegens]